MSRVIIEEINRPTTLYRVGSPTGEGLWYNQSATATGLVSKYGIAAAALPMGPHPVFADGGFHWISVTDSLETLDHWFTPTEMEFLATMGYRLEVIEAAAHRTLSFPDYGYAHQVYRVEDLTKIEYHNPVKLQQVAA